MFASFVNSFNTVGSCAAANESVSASSRCAQADTCAATAFLLTLDTACAVSIFVSALRVILIRVSIIISAIIGSPAQKRSNLAMAL